MYTETGVNLCAFVTMNEGFQITDGNLIQI